MCKRIVQVYVCTALVDCPYPGINPQIANPPVGPGRQIVCGAPIAAELASNGLEGEPHPHPDDRALHPCVYAGFGPTPEKIIKAGRCPAGELEIETFETRDRSNRMCARHLTAQRLEKLRADEEREIENQLKLKLDRQSQNTPSDTLAAPPQNLSAKASISDGRTTLSGPQYLPKDMPSVRDGYGPSPPSSRCASAPAASASSFQKKPPTNFKTTQQTGSSSKGNNTRSGKPTAGSC